MLIAVLDLHTTPADRVAALAQLDAERDEIRAMPGNLDFRVYADRTDDGGVRRFRALRRGAAPADGCPAAEPSLPGRAVRDGLTPAVPDARRP